ncbi:MAG: hypothetical protein UR66_C0004G0102 [Candidatus Moranbacteria bacterium GW2011_GWE1_35_17]|nr:MAG: hypothetical protein UR66_C0004G0102 [Candidatus Moranbacteria bacterium GW2011_GWE1_35_17]KKP82760.1 MAG: hypothetical protein UR83_C0046G0004 [Candidatus Moranbacteria bacterium GW2011_GWF2_35_54]KKP83958.1 MAG: hypothetical protein UR82_C0015G0010 [Candidatus Moranbacteria bacterium GW2011_GWF1_35_5]
MEGNNFSKFESGVKVNVNSNVGHVDKTVFGSKNKPEEKTDFKKNIFDKIILASFFMLFFGLPIFFTGLSFQGVVFEKQIYFYFWVLVALVTWVAKGVMLSEMKIKRTLLDIPIAFFLVFYLISTFFSVDKWHSFWGFFGDPSRGLLGVLFLVVMYYLILSNFNFKTLKWCLGGLVLSSMLVSVFSLLVMFGVKIAPASLNSYIPLSLIGTVSGLKVFLGMMIPLLLVVSLKMNESKKKYVNILGYIALAFVPINLLIVSMVFDKIISATILFGVGFFLLYILSHIVRPKENLAWIPMVAFVLAMIVLATGKNDLAKVNIPIEASPNMEVSWEIVKGGLKEDPMLGSGPATYGFDFSKYKPQAFNENIFYGIRFYQGTGLFFESFSTLGILGAVALLAIVVVFINVAIYLISQDKEKNKIYSLGLLSASIISIVSAFVFRVDGTIILLSAMVGSITMAVIFLESGMEERYLKLSLKASPKFALTLAFIFIIVSAGVAVLFVYIGKAYLADIYAGVATRVNKVTEEGSIKNLNKAISLNDKEGRYYSRVGQEYMVLANEEASKPENSVDVTKIGNYVSASVAYAKEGVSKMPNDALSVSVLAQIYESLSMQVDSTLELAFKSYENLLSLEPHNPVAYLKLGQIKIVPALKETDATKKKALIKESMGYIEKSVKEKTNFAEGYYYLAVTQNALDQKDESINSLISAVNNDKKNLTYLFNLGRAYQEKGGETDIDNAKKIFEYIVSISPEEVNTNFALGTLYEKIGEKDKAVEKYNKVLETVKKLGSDNDETIGKLNKIISNTKAGISNVNIADSQPINSGQTGDVSNSNQEVELIGPAPVQNPVNQTAPIAGQSIDNATEPAVGN